MFETPARRVLAVLGFAILAAYTGSWVWGELAFRYFRHQCEAQAGEFIYRTARNVDGLYQMRPRDPTDYFDRVRKGDIPEDPFGHTNVEAQTPWVLFLHHSADDGAYRFVESPVGPNQRRIELGIDRFENEVAFTGEEYWTYRRANENRGAATSANKTAEQTATLNALYGFTWREVRSGWDKLFGVWGGELLAVELATSEIMGVRRGFILWAPYSDRTGMCPEDKHDYITATFLKKVLQPTMK